MGNNIYYSNKKEERELEVFRMRVLVNKINEELVNCIEKQKQTASVKN